jgi:hypothetical protein
MLEYAFRTVRLWDVASGQQRTALGGHTSEVNAVAFSRDGLTLASAGADGTIRLWDRTAGKECGRFTGHQGLVESLAFSPDGRLLASASADTTVLVWDVTGRMRDGRVPAAKLTPAELGALWEDLASPEPSRAHRAAWMLTAARGPAVAMVKARLRPVPAAGERQVAGWIADLNADKFAVREKASQELERLEKAAEPAVRRALAGEETAEARRRLQALVDRLDDRSPPPERRRTRRAIEVLEHIGTTEARLVLESLAEGAPAADATRQAKAALARLDRRQPPGP